MVCLQDWVSSINAPPAYLLKKGEGGDMYVAPMLVGGFLGKRRSIETPPLL